MNSFGYDHAENDRVTTVLLQDVRDENGCMVASHLWLNRARPFYEVGVVCGDVVKFTGQVARYKKGSTGRTTDFNIRRPSNVRNISDRLECAVQYWMNERFTLLFLNSKIDFLANRLTELKKANYGQKSEQRIL
jgi:hypothetical protein